jgi:uncharacterized membrane protein YfcA
MDNQNFKAMDAQMLIILVLIGLIAGLLSGIVGIGGGIIIVPALVYFVGFSQRQAQGTSLAILLLPIGLLAVMQFYKAGYVNPKVTAVIALAFVVGSYFGSRIALSVPQESLKEDLCCIAACNSSKAAFL